MTKIDFYTHVQDPLNYACRLVRKAYNFEKSVTLVGDYDVISQIDRLLWTFSKLDFIPHCLADAPNARETPVVLCNDASTSPHRVILLNLCENISNQFCEFERILEIVGSTPEQLVAGRKRYCFYRDSGYEIVKH